MLFTFEVLRTFMGTIALMALLALGYGTVTRAFTRAATAQAVLGALFRSAALLAMFEPLHLAQGVIVDLRTVPVTLAGAFLGLPSAVVTALMALAMRIGIGGAGTIAGSASIVMSVLLGLSWAVLVRRPGQEVRNVVLLATLAQLTLVSYALLPRDVAWRAVTDVWPFLVPLRFVGVLMVGALLKREQMIAEQAKQLDLATDRDPLTDLLNRRGFEAAVARIRPEFTGSALLLLDLDRFKRVNDAHGHDAGDAVLRELSLRLTRALQGRGIIGRLGGEELVVFLPSILPRDARQVAERLRVSVNREAFALLSGLGLSVTVSIGGAWSPDPIDLAALLARADRALYAAKDSGRDCCRLDVQRSGAWATPHAVVALTSMQDAAS